MKRIVIPSTGRAIRKELPETRTSQPSTPAIRSSPSSWRRFSRCVHRPLSTPDVLISWPSKDLRVSTEEGEPCSCRQGMALKDMFPLPEQILEMEPEELAAFVLRYLKSGVGEMNRYNFGLKAREAYGDVTLSQCFLEAVIACLAAAACVATTALMPTVASAGRGGPMYGTWNWPPYAAPACGYVWVNSYGHKSGSWQWVYQCH